MRIPATKHKPAGKRKQAAPQEAAHVRRVRKASKPSSAKRSDPRAAIADSQSVQGSGPNSRGPLDTADYAGDDSKL
jgi:hypothetical protein